MTLDQRRAAGRKGAARTAEIKRQRKADPLWGIKTRLPDHFRELELAATGKGAWKDLPLPQRLSALLKVIEYGVGKSIGLDKMAPKDVQSEGGGIEAAEGLKFE